MRELFEHVGLPDQLMGTDLGVTNKSGKRFYKAPGGELLPSVTTVTGWEKRQFFAEWRRKNPQESKRVLSQGTSLHKVIEDYLNNDADYMGNAKPKVMNLFNYIKPLLHKIKKIRAQEVALWSTKIGLAGRVDCIAEYDGKLSVIDFKSSKREKKVEYIDNYFAQATAYSLMWQEITGIPIEQIVILISSEDGTIQEFTDKPISHVARLKEMIDAYNLDCGVTL